VNAIITAQQWNNLVADVNKAYLHQNNTNFPGYATIGGIISSANLLLLDNIANGIIANRASVNAAQLAGTNIPYWKAAPWGGPGNLGTTQTGTITFASANAAQYYFNQGGSIYFKGTYRGLPVTGATAQDSAWSDESGRFEFTINNRTSTSNVSLNFNSLTGTLTQYFSNAGPTGNYSTNYIHLSLSISSAVISYSLTYEDVHDRIGAGPDIVIGTTTQGVGFGITPFVATLTANGGFTGTAPTVATVTAW
jgi:hypothetical protein